MPAKREFAVIGLGSFGGKVAETLAFLGVPVVGVDKNRQRVDAFRGVITQPVRADVTDREQFLALGLEGIDIAVVSLGTDIEASVLATIFLREQGIKHITVKGISPEHKKILRLMGATQVIFPEEEMAKRLAHSLLSPNILDYIPLVPGYSIVELLAPPSFWEKSLLELNVRRAYGVEVLAIKSRGDKDIKVIPSALERIEEGDTLILLGKDEDIKTLREVR